MLNLGTFMLGPQPGGRVRGRPVVGEGVETTLSARQLGLRPAWAMGGLGAIGRLPVRECGLPDRPGRDRRGENGKARIAKSLQRGPPLGDRQGALEIRGRVRRVRLSARATTKGHGCRL